MVRGISLGIVKRLVDGFDRVRQHLALAGSHRNGFLLRYRIWISERLFDRTVYGKRVFWTYPIILPKVIHRWILLGNARSRFDNGSNARFLLRRRGSRFEIRQVAEGCYT